MPLSTTIALTGVAIPIASSFALGSLANATALQSFAAGAALCSTSLGTTFTILGTTGLLKTRLGVVLTSAAMMDDVVGLVMVQVISNLGGATSGFNAATVIRPVFVSLGFALVCPLVCWGVVKPLTLWLSGLREKNRSGVLERVLVKEGIVFCVHTMVLIGLITGATYAGTSNLFAAYLAGAMISWWDSEVPHVSAPSPTSEEQEKDGTNTTPAEDIGSSTSGWAIYERYFQPANDRILKPFFFVSNTFSYHLHQTNELQTSIGFSIPITLMFDGPIVWRGIIYSILMLISKLLCGAWLIRFSLSVSSPAVLRRAVEALKAVHVPHLWHRNSKREEGSPAAADSQGADQEKPASSTAARNTPPSASSAQTDSRDNISAAPSTAISPTTTPSHTTSPASKPISLYPASILGLAMVSRGEIGFLISSLAESNDIFSEEVFLIVTWAIVLCTVVGPVCVGLLVRRVKKLEKVKDGVGGRDVLGVWGVE